MGRGGERLVGRGGSTFRGAGTLPVFELDGREAPENGNGNLELPAGGVDLVNPAVEVHERSVGDLHFLADIEGYLGNLLAGGCLQPGLDLVDLRLAQRCGMIAADETDHT